MTLIIKYLKKSWKMVLLIITFLIVQAICDLALPEYTSRIINIGVQQGGIEDSVMEVIRESHLKELSYFMNKHDYEIILSNYELIDKDTLNTEKYDKYLKEYRLLETENLYVLKSINDSERKKLENIIAKPMLMRSLFTSNNEEALNIQKQFKENLPENMQEMDIMIVLSMLKEEQLIAIQKKIGESFEGFPDTIIIQGAVAVKKEEYQTIGININKIQTGYVIMSGLKMLGLAIISMIATIIVGYIGAKMASKFAKNLRNDVFEKTLSFSTTEFKEFTTSSLITRTTNDVQQVQMFLVFMLRVIFYAPILGVGGVIKVLNTNTTMGWVLALAIMTVLSVIVLMFALVMPKFKVVQKLIDRLNLVTREIITGIPVIRAFSNQKKEEERFDKANKNLKRTTLFVNMAMSIMMPLMMFIMNAVCILIVWEGAHGIDQGLMQVGDMLAFIQYTMQVIMSFLMISMFSIMMPRASVSLGRIKAVLNKKNVIIDPENPKTFSKRIKGTVEFKNVSFKYPDSDEDVLTDINFKIEPKTTTAFIGSTGSGKSTLINLIPRLFDVTKGEVLVNDINVKDIKLQDLHNIIGFIPQKGVLFSGTIESNITYGNTEISKEEIERAARISQATDFIKEKEENYNYKIAQGGTNVSGGQKQRLSIARAIAKNPEIYIFDDSFSALDFKTDANLRRALKEEIKEATILIVAQRINTILHADQIIVLNEGKIVGIGKHKELLKKCSVYREIATSQLSKEELENA